MRLILGILLLASVGLNVFFLTGKGINITHHHDQHQNQQQAQLVIGNGLAQGHIVWKKAKVADEESFLNNLAPEQALFAKMERGLIIYPELQSQTLPQAVPKTIAP